MNPADVKVTARDVFGREITGCHVDVVTKYGEGGKHYRGLVTKAGYKADAVNLDFKGHGELVLYMDPEQCACPSEQEAMLATLVVKMESVWVAGKRVADMLGRVMVTRADRAWWSCQEELLEAVQHSEVFKNAPDSMHHPPEGHEDWTKVGVSVKTMEPYCSLQLVFWRDAEGNLIVEADIDLNNKLLKHLVDALIKHPVTGQPDPRTVAQLLVLYCGLPMGFEMRPRERAA